MRILFDSKKIKYKNPFGTLPQGQNCVLHIHIPLSVPVVHTECVFTHEDGAEAFRVTMQRVATEGAYGIYRGSFTIEQTGLYFYYFHIYKPDSSFRLFKYADQTNMEDGALWQLTCTPKDFKTPDWAKGAVIYQVFPDRFCKSGECDLSGKLTPYTVHENWDEEVTWQPTEEGIVLNNDFFGGNFNGITEKMDYIASLGTTILYLNPISKSFSNHRYDTGDYKTPDPMLGTVQDFKRLCDAAHAHGIYVILDGVFSHTGANSLYFDKEGAFGGVGAYQTPESKYHSWYTFYDYPDSYNSWWGFDTLPTVNKNDPAFIDYIIESDDSVVAHWLSLGADGFRLDVADELPDAFIKRLKEKIRSIRPDALLIGEVWEDASNKISYGIRRRYFADGELDSCMNYPLRTAILNFMKRIDDGTALCECVMTILENYPQSVIHCNMNLLGTHDTARILTALTDDFNGSRAEKAARRLSDAQLKDAQEMLKMASFLQFMLPGAPSIYYADEAGMEGYEDPFNRRPYPWGKQSQELLCHYRHLGDLKKTHISLRFGDTQFFCAQNGRIGFTRSYGSEKLSVYLNRSDTDWVLPHAQVLYSTHLHENGDGFSLSAMGFCIVKE